MIDTDIYSLLHPTVAEIQAKVSERFRIPRIEMISARRAREVARPRQVAMYLAKQLTTLSLPNIGKHFGNRDHTTVMHACRQVERLMAADRAMRSDVLKLRRTLERIAS